MSDKKKIYQDILFVNGEKAAIIKAMGEMAELWKELCHYLLCFESKIDNKFDTDNLKSEIADVEIWFCKDMNENGAKGIVFLARNNLTM